MSSQNITKSDNTKPRQGIHAYRVFDYAIIDVVFTFIGALILWYVIAQQKESCKNVECLMLIFVYLLVIGIVTHYFLGIKTKLNTVLGLA